LSEITMHTEHFNSFTIRSFIKDTLSDLEGHWSMKRFTVAVGMFLFVIAFFANTFFHYAIDASIMNVLTTIIVAGLAVTGAERFGKGFENAAETNPILPTTKPLESVSQQSDKK
jgi:hypothetical protein